MFLIRRKPISKEAQILKLIKKSGHYGVYNYELAKICLNWHQRITDLRQSGESIVAHRVSNGVFKYYWYQS
jgi:hypothetical protein